MKFLLPKNVFIQFYFHSAYNKFQLYILSICIYKCIPDEKACSASGKVKLPETA